jgi:hypothetical protein
MLFAVSVYITAFTLVPHKEFRFIAPILPMLNVWSEEGMTVINRISQLLIISMVSALNVYIYLFDWAYKFSPINVVDYDEKRK